MASGQKHLKRFLLVVTLKILSKKAKIRYRISGKSKPNMSIPKCSGWPRKDIGSHLRDYQQADGSVIIPEVYDLISTALKNREKEVIFKALYICALRY